MNDATLSQHILESYDDLTHQERRLADLLLENPDLLGLHSATEISIKADEAGPLALAIQRTSIRPSKPGNLTSLGLR